ncbi:MAG: CHAT domain-containing protein [Gloeobacterales cyanobacterium]
MMNKILGWLIDSRNWLKKMYGGRFAFSSVSSLSMLEVLPFLLPLAFPLLTAQVAFATPILQTQQDNSQLVEKGRALYQAGQFEEAATIWQQAADALAARGDKLNQAMALSNFSLTEQQLGKWEEAKTAIAQSLNLLETQPKTPAQQRIFASTLDIQGQLQRAVGQRSNALETWQQAADIYREIGNTEGVIGSQINQAQALQDLGLYPRACQILLDTLELNAQKCEISKSELQNLKAQQSLPQQILGLRSLGNVLRVIGQTGQSQIVLLKSLQLAQQVEKYPDLGAIYLSLGNTVRALGNKKLLSQQTRLPGTAPKPAACISRATYDRAVEFYQQAADCYRQAELEGSPTITTQAQLNLLSLAIQTQQETDIPALLPTIQSQINRLPLSRTAISAQLKLAQNLLCLQAELSQENLKQAGNVAALSSPILQSCFPVKQTAKNPKGKALSPSQIPDLPDIRQRVTAALQQAQLLGDKQAEANALGYLAAVSQQMGKWGEAQQLTEQALQRLSAFDTPELAYLWQWQLGRLYQLQEKPKEAIAAYTLAFQLLQSLRQDLVATNPDIQFTFRDSVEPVYRELVALLLQPSPTTDHQGEVSQDSLKKARDIIEALQLAELNNFFQEACLEGKPQQIDQLDTKAAVIYSIILPERLAVILSVPGQPLRSYGTALTSSSGAEAVERTYDDLVATLNPFIASPNPLVPSQQIYNWLIRPAEAELAKNGIKTLVFVLDGVLRGVPVAALHDGQQYLMEKYSIALTPGLQLFNPRRPSLEKSSVLVGGLTESRLGFSALPSVTQEVKNIAKIASTKILLNGEFTRNPLENKIQSNAFPIVHLATHGQFSSLAEDTFLLTWDERINVKNLDQLLREQDQFVRSPIELLILSACQTAMGDKRAALGLAGVAVRSGARSTLATLWSVQDESTADFMTKFYQVLNQPNVSKAEALRQAQLSLLHSPQYQHPFYWAAFVLVGNWL